MTLCGALLLVVWAAKPRTGLPKLSLGLDEPRFTPWFEIIVGCFAFMVFYIFPIKGLAYGDAKFMVEKYSNNEQFDPRWIKSVLHLNPFFSKEALSVFIHRAVAHLFSIPIQASYRVLGAVWGSLFVTGWLLFVRTRPQGGGCRTILILAGLFSGANAVFFGHVENYGFAYLCWALLLFAAALYFDLRISWFWVFPLFVLAIKAHAAALAFLPALLYLISHHFRTRSRAAEWLTRPKSVLLALVLPFLVAGLAVYIFLGSYKEPYTGPSNRQMYRSFLPLLPSGPPPLDRYSLLSPLHLVDLLNVAALVTVPASVLILGFVLWQRREIPWHKPQTVFFILAFMFPALFFFAVNPALTMPRDWDLYALGSAPVLFLLAAILPSHVPRSAIALTAALGLFPVSFVLVNASAERQSFRIVDAATWSYSTYYAGAGYFMRLGFEMDPNAERAETRRLSHLAILRKIAVGEDEEFVTQTCKVAVDEVKQGRYDSAVALLQEAVRVSPNSIPPHSMLAAIALNRNQVPEAAIHIKKLLELAPQAPETQAMAVQLGLMTDDREMAETHLAQIDSLASKVQAIRKLRDAVHSRWPN